MILEVRPGEGGEDAAVFARELKDALTAYANRLGCSVRTVPENGRTLQVRLDGKRAGELETFIGTHRVQRIPAGEKRGRRHTSTATVALLPDEVEVSVTVPEDELEIQFYRGTGPGGQHRNKASTAVRVRHRKSGTTVEVESGRSQHQNLTWAKEEVRRRLEEQHRERGRSRRNEERTTQIRSGERPIKSFTHNTQRDEVRCHETGQRWRLAEFLKGRLGRD